MNSHVDWFQLGPDSRNRYIQNALPKTSLPVQVPNVTLEVVRGTAKRLMRKVESPVFLIGSASDCDLVLGDKGFPEVHTYLFLNESGVTVRRIAPEPEVRINEVQCETGELGDGDLLRLGPYEFRVHISPSNDPSRKSRLDEGHTFPRPNETAETKSDVEPLLDDIRDHINDSPTTLRLHTEDAFPWQSVTTDTGLRVRPAG